MSEQRFQPNFATPRIAYNGRRESVHPDVWATDQGVPNDDDPNPSYPEIHVPMGVPWRERVRPQIWKRADEDPDKIGTGCIYGFSISVATDSGDGQTIYLKEGILPTCYYLNSTEGALSYSGSMPPACGSPVLTSGVSGTYHPFFAPIHFKAWWNLWVVCDPDDPPPDTSFGVISNQGTCPIRLTINGTLSVLNPGDPPFGFDPLVFDGVDGDESGFGGGTPIIIEPGP